MKNPVSKYRLLLYWLAGAWLVGCGATLPATVSGVITIDGQLPPESENVSGNVMFYPVGGGAAGFGDVVAGGAYRVTTGSTKGIEPGEYVVTVRIIEIGALPEDGSAPPQRLLSPQRYNDRESSELRVTVVPGHNTIDLKLMTSSG